MQALALPTRAALSARLQPTGPSSRCLGALARPRSVVVRAQQQQPGGGSEENKPGQLGSWSSETAPTTYETTSILPGAFTRRRDRAMLGRGGAAGGTARGGAAAKGVGRREHVVARVAALGFAFSIIGELLTGVGPITQDSRKTMVRNEVWVGRIAMVGFLGAVLLEYKWGGVAPLAHLGLIQPGVSLTDAPWWAILVVSAFLLTGLGVFGAFTDPKRDQDAY
eukprot:scaffold8.g1410.t1